MDFQSRHGYACERSIGRKRNVAKCDLFVNLPTLFGIGDAGRRGDKFGYIGGLLVKFARP